MSITCMLFGHRRLSDDYITFDFGGAKYKIGVCIMCNVLVARPCNDRARVIELEDQIPLGLNL